MRTLCGQKGNACLADRRRPPAIIRRYRRFSSSAVFWRCRSVVLPSSWQGAGGWPTLSSGLVPSVSSGVACSRRSWSGVLRSNITPRTPTAALTGNCFVIGVQELAPRPNGWVRLTVSSGGFKMSPGMGLW